MARRAEMGRRAAGARMLWVWAAIVAAAVWGGVAAALAGEVEALLEVKAALRDSEGRLADWAPAATPCGWRGVTCDGATVVLLDLSALNLSGTLSPALATLPALQNLSLAANNLSGPLPTELSHMASLRYLNISNNCFSGTFPRNFSQLKSLQVLDAFNNNFSGELPLEVSQLMNLRHLHLGGNFFTGGIHPQYGNMEGLTYLALSGNALTGRIPPELGNLGNLEYLYIGYYNQFDGGIPVELGRLSRLIRLDMSSSGLNGSIPSELGALSNLDTLFLQMNSLSGSIPASLANLSSLRSLDLSINRLSGLIPPELASLPRLELLHLFLNFLHGSIPQAIGSLPRLQVLQLYENNLTGLVPPQLGSNGQLLEVDLSSNSLHGPVPPDVCHGGNLRSLVLMDNRLSGGIPAGLGDCPKLDRVRLGQNQLSGPLPPGLLAHPVLNFLELQFNRLTGTLPTDFAPGSTLGSLDISNNLLSGRLPSSIGNLTQLVELDLSGNSLTGSIPPEIGLLKRLSKLDLSNNQLEGPITASLSACEGLVSLDLSRNRLQGEILPQLSKLMVLATLNVSRNRLNGSIPSSLESMATLAVVDFSYNNLSGWIPDSGQFSNFNASSFLGNPGLCGKQLPLNCRAENSSQFPDVLSAKGGSAYKKSHTSTWLVVVGVVGGIVLVGYIVYLIHNKRDRQLLCASFKSFYSHCKTYQMGKAWKLTAFERLDFSASDVLDCLNDDNIIGKGGSGTVYKGCMPNGQMVAVKRLQADCKSTSQHDYGFSAEIQTLGNIRHRHIVRLLGCCSNHDTNLLVYEYMPNGSLGEVLHGPRGGSLSWTTRYRIAIEAAKGLCYLHHDCSPLIVHRDVKSNNILLDSNYEAHVADFGLARVLRDLGKSELMSSVAGSYGYIAPEYAYTLKVNEKSDIYSFGIVLLELLTGRRPIEPEYGDCVDIARWVRKKVQTREGTLEVLDARMGVTEGSKKMQEVMLLLKVALLCLVDPPDQRPTLREVVQMLTDIPKAKESKSGGMAAVSPPDLITI